MEDLSIEVKKLQGAVQTLVKQYKHLQKENQLLKTENEVFKKNLLQNETLLQKQTVQNLALLHNDDEKKILQEKIDCYLKDIEKCLSLLNA